VGESVTLLVAVGAGVLSFISPFVLPFVPVYVSLVSGRPLGGSDGYRTESVARFGALAPSLAFVLGFTMVFIAFGVSANFIGQFLLDRLPLAGRLAGVIVILFGLHALGVGPRLRSGKKDSSATGPVGFTTAILLGGAFAVGWTPCIGPILAGLLALAGIRDSVGQGVGLLAAYSFGLAIPFLAAPVAVARCVAAFTMLRTYARAIEMIAGVLLVVIGTLIIANRLAIAIGTLTP
jgi:cytochrome c-type biogenesis protein